jgi:hypothetical protein
MDVVTISFTVMYNYLKTTSIVLTRNLKLRCTLKLRRLLTCDIRCKLLASSFDAKNIGTRTKPSLYLLPTHTHISD